MSAAPGVERRRLIGLPLSGLRRDVRRMFLGGLAITAALSALGFALGQERARSSWGEHGDWGEWHSFAAETGFVPVLAPLVVLLLALWARRGGLPRGLVAAIASLANNVALLACAIDAHLFDSVDASPGQAVAALLQVVLFGLGAVLLVLEPVFYIRERRALEAEDPVFATARVVRDRRR